MSQKCPLFRCIYMYVGSLSLSSVIYRYITVLVEMTRFEGTRQGHLIAGQMLDVTIRVRDVRPFAVKQMVRTL